MQTIPTQDNQLKLIAEFRASAGLSNDFEARGYLECCDWNLVEALAARDADYRGADWRE